MFVLITGGAGFIGSHTADGLLVAGHRVRVLDVLDPRVHRNGVPEYLDEKVELIRGDVRRREDLGPALEGVDAVIHLAAYQDYMTDFSHFFDVNTVGTALLYELIVEKHLPIKKIVIASSQSVYGEGPYICENSACPEKDVQWPEAREEQQLESGDWDVTCPQCRARLTPATATEQAVKPGNSYAISKYSQELIGFTLGRRYGISTTAMRYSIVQGPRQSFTNAYSGACRIFCLRMHLGYRPLAYEDGLQVRDYVNISDVVRANLLVLEHPDADGQAYNVGGGRAVTVLEFADVVARAFGQEADTEVPGKYRFGDTRHIISDITKLGKLGWSPRGGIDESVRSYVEWLTSQPGLDDYIAEADQAMALQEVVREVQN